MEIESFKLKLAIVNQVGEAKDLQKVICLCHSVYQSKNIANSKNEQLDANAVLICLWGGNLPNNSRVYYAKAYKHTWAVCRQYAPMNTICPLPTQKMTFYSKNCGFTLLFVTLSYKGLMSAGYWRSGSIKQAFQNLEYFIGSLGQRQLCMDRQQQSLQKIASESQIAENCF